MVVLGLPIVGAAAGGFVGGLRSAGDMGFDQIGSVLGGIATGVLAGLILAIALARRLTDRMLQRVALVTASAVLIVTAVLFFRYRVVSDETSRDEQTPVAAPT